MKRFKIFVALMVLLCGTSLYAKSFDWSECWCNYGGGISEGDFIVNVSTGIIYTDVAYAVYDDFWFIPPVMVEVQYAQPIWKLPFTFGGYAGLHAYGYSYDVWNSEKGKWIAKDASYWAVFFGGEAAYHIQMPPKGLDLYAVTRIGGNIPFVKPGKYWTPDYFQFGEAIGANWFFGDTFGVNAEFGYPFSRIGATFKF